MAGAIGLTIGLMALSVPVSIGVHAAAGPFTQVPGNASTTHPNSNIVPATSTIKYTHFVPKALTAKHASGTCTATNYSFSIGNTTKVKQQLTYKGQPLFAPLPPKRAIDVCVTAAGKYVLGLKSAPKATLTLTIT